MENQVNAAAPAEAQTQQQAPKLDKPVHPEGSPKAGEVINIIGPNCEFCGINASKCEHNEAFRANGMLKNSEALKEEAKLYRNFDGLPRVLPEKLGGHCEFCGIDAGKCQHAPERRKRAKIDVQRSLSRTEVDRVNGARVHVKEPEDQSVSEEHLTGEEAKNLKAEVEAQNVAQKELESQPEISDEVVGEQLDNLPENEGVGMEDENVDV